MGRSAWLLAAVSVLASCSSASSPSSAPANMCEEWAELVAQCWAAVDCSTLPSEGDRAACAARTPPGTVPCGEKTQGVNYFAAKLGLAAK